MGDLQGFDWEKLGVLYTVFSQQLVFDEYTVIICTVLLSSTCQATCYITL